MSNVIIGIIGAMMVIGLALASATYFGPRVTQTHNQGDAQLAIEAVSSAANAIRVRDLEKSSVFQSGTDLSSLNPDYLPEAPRNPFGGPAPMALNATGDTTGVAHFVALKLAGLRASKICDEISRQTGGPVPAPAGAMSYQIGCVGISTTMSPNLLAGDYIAYARL
ncbi:hypothetical protein [Sphingosinicella sp. BN140058]|uniref:hypothetical protein n=1 Tax=Sphingosinicella sp. BN140058 TaxID=1892855 RepID=UPI001011F8A7|nr:hypothetical protein [Sphingosinicella sp. BN140058]QAY80143.1 hypothetical protein ETR14_26230 [Sphingosinicella sp. BN140058]